MRIGRESMVVTGMMAAFGFMMLAGCNPRAADPCSTIRDDQTCVDEPGCFWYAPGCSEPGEITEPFSQGCYTDSDCRDAGCGEGLTCAAIYIDPCYLAICNACGGTAWACIPE